MRIVCISDTHQFHESIEVPDGDVLIHAGDSTNHGSLKAARQLNEWFGSLPHKHKILVAGNHDFHFRNHNADARQAMSNVIYLQDEEIVIDGIKFYGSPWSNEFGSWAFMDNELELERHWANIPDDVQVLVTHGPPHGILDLVSRGPHVGSVTLLDRVKALKQLRIHVFGHIHEEWGTFQDGNVNFINASSCDEYYAPVNRPIVVDIEEV